MIVLYFDHHVPSAIARGIRLRGIDVLTAEDDASKQLPDDDLLSRATSLGRALVSHDRDLPEIVAQWQAAGRMFAGLVRITHAIDNYGWLITDLDTIAQCHAPGDMDNQVMYIPFARRR